ncbi:MAG: antitoxin [Spirochaetales bacterium]|nr:antitoxin [Spirochaetales bacterium]
MRSSYDFAHAIKNPYVSRLKKQITIRIDADTIEYFKTIAGDTGIKYQQLINLYLSDCAKKNMKPDLEWKASAKK